MSWACHDCGTPEGCSEHRAFCCSRCHMVVPWSEGGSPDEVDEDGDLCASCWALRAREWSRLPGLGTAEGQLKWCILHRWGGDPIWITSIRLPEPSVADCSLWLPRGEWPSGHVGACMVGLCNRHAGECPARTMERTRRAAISAARAGGGR